MYLALRLRGENGSLWLGSAASCQRARCIGGGRFISHQIRAAFESMLWLSSSRWWRDTVYFSAARRMILFWISCVWLFFFPPPGCLHYNHRPARSNGREMQMETFENDVNQWKKMYMAWSLCWRRLPSNRSVCLLLFFFMNALRHSCNISLCRGLCQQGPLLHPDTVYDITISIIHFNTAPSLRTTSFLGVCTQ